MEPPQPKFPRVFFRLAAFRVVLLRLAIFFGVALLPGVARAVEAATGSSEGADEHINIPLYLFFVLLLVLANGFFVAAEFALVGVRHTRIDQLAAEGIGSARVVQGALRELDRYIAATQVGITIASLLLGGIGERTFHHLFEPFFEMLPLPEAVSAGAVAFGLSYFVMTALHVIIGELMPKSIALQFSEKTSLAVVRPLVGFAWVFAPLIWILNGTGNFLLKRLGIHPAEGHAQVHSPEELDLLVAQSHEGGQLNDTEAEILHRVVRFSDLTTREIMVPRVEMQSLPRDLPQLALRAWIHSKPHSRVPVYVGSFDEVLGVIHLKDLVPFAAKVKNLDDDTLVSLEPLVREVLRVPETMTVDRLLVEFKRERQQMAIVIDEYGGTAGLVTLGDLLEQVFGEVADEFDAEEEEVQVGEDGTIALAGRVLIETVNEKFGFSFEHEEADTMAGLILNELGRQARPGDEVAIEGALLRVEKVDRLRITHITLRPPSREQVSAEA